jgi:hypothetical protein
VKELVQTERIHDPHPYMQMWVWCRNLQGDSSNRLLPYAGGVMDQPWEVVWAFGVIDDAYREERELKQEFEKSLKNATALRQSLLRTP